MKVNKLASNCDENWAVVHSGQISLSLINWFINLNFF